MTDKFESPFRTDEDRTAETARLNDLARTAPQGVNAAWFTTAGVAALIEGDPDRARELVQAIAGFSDFDPGNDPYGERDFGALTLWGERLFWKIDYYHPEREEHSPVRWSAELTRRVLTVLLATEY
jgi:hypothetical protein